MRFRIATMLLVLSAVAPAVSAQSIDVKPDSFEFSGIAGDDFVKDVNVSWSGVNVQYIDVSTSVSASSTNTNGFSVSLSDRSLVLEPGETRTINALINTSPGLKPDTFSVDINARSKVRIDEDDDSSNVDSGGDIERYITIDRGQESDNTTNGSNFNVSNDNAERLDDISEDVSNVSERVDELSDNLSDIEQDVEGIQRGFNSLNTTLNNRQSSTNSVLGILVLVALLFIIVGLSLLTIVKTGDLDE